MKKIIYVVLVFAFIASVWHQTALAQQEGGAIQAIDEVREGSGSAGNAGGAGSAGKPGFQSKSSNLTGGKRTTGKSNKTRRQAAPATAKSAAPKPTKKSDSKYDGFVLGDKYTFLNFEMVERVQPVYTLEAKEAGAKGLVQVEILIGENGRVLSAKARTGNELLHAEAEKAALAAVFNKPEIYGKPARAIGFLVYRFGKKEAD